MKKKILSLVVIMTLIINLCLNSLSAMATTLITIGDTTGPVFVSFSFDKEVYKPGEKVKISIETYDEESTIRSIQVNLKLKNYDKYYHIYDFVYDEVSNKYVAEFEVTENTPSEIFEVSNITIWDYPENITWVNDPQKYTFRVTGTEGKVDFIGPVAENVALNLKEATVNDNVIISVDVTDDLSGVARVTAAYYTPDNVALEIDCNYNESSKKYEGILPIDKNTLCGTYLFHSIFMVDNSGNHSSKYLDSSAFKVYGTDNNEDLINPTVYYTSVAKSYAELDDENAIYVQAEDTLSGIDKIEMTYKTGNKEVKINDFVLEDNSIVYKSTFITSDKFSVGDWEFSKLEVTDKAGNKFIYDRYGNNECEINFTDIKVIDKFIIPEMVSFKANKTSVTKGDIINFSFKLAENGSQVDKVTINLGDRNFELLGYDTIMTYNKDTKCYEFSLIVDENTLSGVFKANVSVWYGNSAYGFSMRDSITISGTNESVEDYYPSVGNVEFDKSSYTVGETITVKVKVDSKKTNIQSMELNLVETSFNGDYAYIDLFYNYIEDCYVGKFKVTEEMLSGSWSGSSVHISSDNYKYFNIEIETETIKISGTNNTIPEINNIFLSETQYNVGSKLKVLLDIDSKNILNNVTSYLYIKTTEHIGQEINFVYNDKLKLYEGELYLNTKMPTGEYRLANFSYIDNEGGYKQINSNNISNTYIKINGNNKADVTLPILKGINVNIKEAKAGDTVKIEVNAEDKESGIEYVELYYSIGDDDYNYHSIILDYNEKTNLYEKQFTVDNNTISGDWNLQFINIASKETNMYIDNVAFIHSFEHDITDGNFKVITEGESDLREITINNIWFDRKIILPGETVKVYVDADIEPEMISKFTIGYNGGGPNFRYLSTNFNYNNTTGYYEVTLNIPSYMYGYEGQIYLVCSIQAFNAASGYKDISEIKFRSYDINNDYKIDITDLSTLATKYNTKKGIESWQENYDLNNDNIIDLYDLVKMSKEL